MITKHQQEIYSLTNDSQKTLANKISEYEEKIKQSDANNKKIIDEKDNTIKSNNKQINNLNTNVSNLENNVSSLKSENSEKGKKINILEGELADATKNANGIKNKYEALTEKLEKEYNMRNVLFNNFL